MRQLLLATTVIGVAAAFAGQSHAQSVTSTPQSGTPQSGVSIKEVTVTAERRKSNVQKTAASVTVLNGDDLAKEGRYTVAQILEDVPGVSGGAGNGDDPGAGITIRGVAADGVPAGTSAVAPTAVYVDGVYEGIGGDYDISRVEVLRGPQGTLYGRSATGGVVSTYTRDPVLGKAGADINVEYGSYDLRHVNAAVNLPVNDVLAVRASGNEFDQLGALSLRGGSTAETDARVKALYQPSADLSALIGWAVQQNHGHSGGATLETTTGPNTWAKETASIYPTESHMRQFWGNFNWTSPVGTLTYIPAFHSYSTHGQQLIGDVIRQDNLETYDQFLTQELRVSALPGSQIDWVGGAFYYDNALTNSTVTHWIHSGALTFDQLLHKNTHNEGVFADVIVPVADTWKITGGARFDHTKVSTDETYISNDATPVGNPFSSTWFLPEVLDSETLSGSAGLRTYDNFTFRARVEKQITPQNIAYALVSTGFLPGDVALSKAASGPIAIPYAQERLTAYELGSKNRFLDNSLQINGDVYYYHYSGYQQVVNTTGNPQNPSFATETAPARMEGAELEAVYRLTPFDRLNVSYGYINAYFVNQTADFLEYQAQTRIPGIAPNAVSASYDHSFSFPDGSTLNARDQVRFASGYDLGGISASEASYGAEPYVHVGDTVVDDVTLNWSSANSKYSVTGYINNIGDAVYKQAASLSEADAGGVVATINTTTPRTFGVVLHASY